MGGRGARVCGRLVNVITATRATAALADIACREYTSQAALERAHAAVIDTLGVMLAGACEPAARIVSEAVQADGACRIIGTGFTASATDAALANGTAAHALDFDDVSPTLVGHPSAVLVPALLASVEQQNADGPSFLSAYVAGFEIAARLGRALNPTHYERGWHATATLGAPAAAAAVARLEGLNEAATHHALSIAGSLAGGLRASFGSMVKPLHAGHAARSGVLAARLAARGFTAADSLFEAPAGFAELFGEGEAVDWDVLTRTADAPEIITSGIQVKPFPSCAMTHTAIDAMLSLRNEVRDASQLLEIDCTVPPIAPRILIHRRPNNGLEAKFSMQYCLAVTLLDGPPGVAQFSDERVARDDVQQLLRRVTVGIGDEHLEDLTRGHTPVQVQITRADGQRLRAERSIAPGAPERPLSRAELEQKFLDNAARVLGPAHAHTALAALNTLPHSPSVRDVLDHLSP